jgi:hypothetical protein
MIVQLNGRKGLIRQYYRQRDWLCSVRFVSPVNVHAGQGHVQNQGRFRKVYVLQTGIRVFVVLVCRK